MDIKAKSNSDFLYKDSNPGTVDFSAGGVVRNIAHNLASLKIPVKLISIIGDDWEGERVLKITSDGGVDTTYVECSKQYHTGTYIALLNSMGEMEAAVSCMDIFFKITPAFLETKLEVIKNSGFIVCDTNIPPASVQYLVDIAEQYNIPICIEPVSVSKAKAIKDKLSKTTFITPNIYELEELSDTCLESFDITYAASKLIDKGVKYVITTLGEKGVCLTSADKSLYIDSYKTIVKDVTGAGDSLTAGFIFGLLKYDSIEAACKCGLAAAAITVASKDTVSAEMCEKKILDIVNI